MYTAIKTTASWQLTTTKATQKSFQNKLVDFINSQAPNRTSWFLVSLLFQGVVFLPVPAALIYYFNAPVLIVAITLILFFANIIAGMGGASIKTLIYLLGLSVLIHILMIAAYLIF